MHIPPNRIMALLLFAMFSTIWTQTSQAATTKPTVKEVKKSPPPKPPSKPKSKDKTKRKSVENPIQSTKIAITQAFKGLVTKETQSKNDPTSSPTNMTINTKGTNFKPAGDPTGEVLQVIGKVIVKKAKEASLKYIEEYLSNNLLKCDKPGEQKLIKVENLCNVLKRSDLHTILTKPDSFLEAFVVDLLSHLQREVQNQLKKGNALSKTIFNKLKGTKSTSLFFKLIDAWKVGGPEAIASVLRNHTKTLLMEAAETQTCPSSSGTTGTYKQSLWVVSQCLKDAYQEAMKHSKQQTELLSTLSSCGYEPKIKICIPSSAPKDEIKKIAVGRLVSLQLAILKSALHPTPNAKEIAKPALQIYFRILKDVIKNIPEAKLNKEKKKAAQELLSGVEKIFVGIMDKDWLATTLGVTEGIGAVLALSNTNNQDEKKTRFEKVAKLVSAIGLYAKTYQNSPKTKKQFEDLQKERQQIIENLIQATVNRSGREQGWVFSIGGTLGLTGGIRIGNPKNGKDILLASNQIPITANSPVSLTLGFAFQGFVTNKWGFHLQLNIFDIGQYLQFEESTFDVALPEVQQAINFSAIVGVWFGQAEIPIVAGLHIGISPFLGGGRSNAFYAGLLIGLYVPIFDF